ncbi:uncharacterized protein MELLADRAFT_116159 [Melampsora larici-populina 98AG31]|uniref:Rho-GAP domain-containing protein n=1 Tax=Melampsora larici-populina (strain 98AG31 / pathotype 3-4-7) TaxID=747676 RepID=F4RI89_MELLP|nr:uncharacterized protein MELLADRAFT_116159 [Melampsora larici-populina 98AG31]EGG07964.1 hypothetical protein MELLADRAFT_116159 [Melampsora larici-populina 98AG31]
MLKFRFPNSKKSNSNSNQSHQESEPTPTPTDQDTLTHLIPIQSTTTTTTTNQTNSSSSPSTSYSEPNLTTFHQSNPTTSTNTNHSSPLTTSNLQDTSIHQSQSNPQSNPNPTLMFPKKTRRKSYGGIRAMLGINQKSEDAPPLPVPIPSSSDPSQPHPPQPHHQHSQASMDASTSPASSLISIPPSPVTAESRPSTSSLRPFPFLGGIRRKSANSNAPKPNPHHLPWNASNHPTPNLPHPTISPTTSTSNLKTPTITSTASSLGHRIYSHGSSKKAQSVDDLSQFGLLPKPRIKPRRSVEELNRNHPNLKSTGPPRSLSSQKNPSDLSKGLDQIGELAGSLASITHEDRQPRLSNPKGMRTVYGVSLEDLYWRDGDQYPLLVNILVELIEEKGIDQQGIYRVPGEKRVIENLQASIDERGVIGIDIWKDSYKDVHNLSGLLKLFLREIPGGVIPFDRYDTFLAVSGIEESLKTEQLHAHVKELPKPNRILLLRLVRHFEKVVANAETNSMLAHNVAIVFAPSLFRSGSEHSNPLLSMQNIGKASAIVRHLVLNVNEIFEIEEGEEEIELERSKVRRAKLENSSKEEVSINKKKKNEVHQTNHHQPNESKSWNIRKESNEKKKSRSSKSIQPVSTTNPSSTSSTSIPNSNHSTGSSSTSNSTNTVTKHHKKKGRQSIQNQVMTTNTTTHQKKS